MTDPTRGYPLPPPPPVPPSHRAARNPALIIAAVIAIVLVIGGVVVAVTVFNRDDSAAAPAPTAVTLEAAADAGTDPFLAATGITEVPAFPDSVVAVASDLRGTLPTDTGIGTLAAPGTMAELYGGRQAATPALYGGSGEQTVCDVEQLADFLEGDAAKAVAWATVHGIEPAGIRTYLQTLTPVTLLQDTAVTNYGFAGGVATPRQSVLQAGTAVLVDPSGLPVVRCACGNPLSAPTVTGLPSAEFLGARWTGFDPGQVLRVTSGAAVPSFTLVDLADGTAFERPAGAAVQPTKEPGAAPTADGPPTIVVVDSGQDGSGAVTGLVSASSDGLNWVTLLTTQGSLSGVGHGEGVTVVVGGDDATGGTVRSSRDGATWTEPIAVPTVLQKVGYGNGQWMAVGTEQDATGGAVAVVYTSPDATAWSKLPGSTGITAASSIQVGSIAFGQGRWQISYLARDTDGRGFGELGVVASTDDGQSWQPVVAAGSIPAGYSTQPVSLDLAFGADQWATVGYTIDDVTADLGSRLGQSGTSAAGTDWVVQPIQLVDTYLDTLAWAGDSQWFARGGLKGGMTGAATDHAVYASTDLQNWTRLGNPGAGLIADIAVTRWASLPAPAGGPAVTASDAPTTSAAVPADAGGCVDGDLTFTVSRPASFPTCEAMIAQWRSFTATGGTETRQGDWICRLPAGSEPGQCALSDTDIYFTVGASGTPAATGAPTAGASAAGSGDLGLTVPISRPACDGTGIVLLLASVTPGAYAAEIQAGLDANPGSSYLRTDQACSSLSQATADGNPIYAVYRVAGADQGAVCAAVRAAGGGAYGKWLDNTTSPSSVIDCG